MKEYFFLQYKLSVRRLKDTNIHPFLGLTLLILGFLGMSLLLFYKTQFAAPIFTLLSLALTSKLSETKRNEFLKICLKRKDYLLVRIIENCFLALPFLIFLLYKMELIYAIILLLLSMLLSLSNFNSTLHFIIPTPFTKKPFEFIVGFRNTFYLFFIAYGLLFIGISVNNFNLGVFSFLLVFLVIFTYYIKPENEYYVWSFKSTPAQFIKEKLKIAFLFSAAISLPFALLLMFFYPENYLIVLVFYTVSHFFLMTVVLAKYAAYPNEIHIPEIIILLFALSFPPLLLLVLPYFYIKATSKLETYLT